jgi:hypothetical protein
MAIAKTVAGEVTEFVELPLTRKQYDVVMSALWAARFDRNGAQSKHSESVFHIRENLYRHVRTGDHSSANASGIYKAPSVTDLGEVAAPVIRRVEGEPKIVLELTKQEAKRLYDVVPVGHFAEDALDAVL